jgi:hypothetical protein
MVLAKDAGPRPRDRSRIDAMASAVVAFDATLNIFALDATSDILALDALSKLSEIIYGVSSAVNEGAGPPCASAFFCSLPSSVQGMTAMVRAED